VTQIIPSEWCHFPLPNGPYEQPHHDPLDRLIGDPWRLQSRHRHRRLHLQVPISATSLPLRTRHPPSRATQSSISKRWATSLRFPSPWTRSVPGMWYHIHYNPTRFVHTCGFAAAELALIPHVHRTYLAKKRSLFRPGAVWSRAWHTDTVSYVAGRLDEG